MATFYTDQGTLQNASVDAKRGDGEYLSGRMRCAIVQYTTVGTEAAADIIRLMFSAHPIILIPQLSHVHATDDIAATTATLDIGDDNGVASADPDRYADGIDVHDGANQLYAFTEDAVPAAVGTPHKTGATGANGEWIDATVKTLTGAAATGEVLTFYITYTIN